MRAGRSALPWRLAVVGALLLCACAPRRAKAADDDLDYVRPLLAIPDVWPKEVTITSEVPVKAQDKVTRSPIVATVAAGTTLPLLRVTDNQVFVSYQYSARRVDGFTMPANPFSLASPKTRYKDEQAKAETPVPIEQTDLARRIVAGLKSPPTVTLTAKVSLPVVLNGRQVGTSPVDAGKVVTVVAFAEGADKVDVDFKGVRGTIPVASVDWEAGIAELRRRQGAASPAPESKPEPTVAMNTPPVETPAPPPPPPVVPPAAAPPQPVTPVPEVATQAPPEKAVAEIAPTVAAQAPRVSVPATPEPAQPPVSRPADTADAGFRHKPARTSFAMRFQSWLWPLAAGGTLLAVVLGVNFTRSRRRTQAETGIVFEEPAMAAVEEPAAEAVEPVAWEERYRPVDATIRDSEPRSAHAATIAEADVALAETVRAFREGQRLFGRYTLKRVLGRGGMGVVWEALDEMLDQEIALKFLPEVVRLDPVALDDLKRETRRCLKLTHPNIVRIYDFVADSQAAGIAMELIDGPTLAGFRIKQPSRLFEVRDISNWVLQLCAALEYAHHDAKVIHRDLKPANLMLTSKGRLKVTDFGVARSVSDSVSRTSARTSSGGTVVYMSPQQAMGEPPAVTDDVYSVGATLFDLLTGTPPFYSGEILLQLLNKPACSIAQRRADLGLAGEEIPPEWEDAITACLSKDPAQRPPSAADLAARLGLAS